MYTTEVVRVVAASRSSLFPALVDPYALARWRVPDDMRAEVLDVDAADGGSDGPAGFRMSLTYARGIGSGKSDDTCDAYRSRFVERESDVRVVERIEFESSDASIGSSMTMTTTLRDVPGGTEATVVHEGIPDLIPRADNELGTRMALDRLARLVETS